MREGARIYNKILLVSLLFLVGFGGFLVFPKYRGDAKAEVAYWYSADWQYRKEIIIDHSKVSEDVEDFVFLFSQSSDNDLRDRAQADGGDIVFTASDGTTELAYQFEKYDNTTGEIVAWVKVPEIFSAIDTKVYIYYGNATCENREDAEAVWTNGEAAVWHLGETGVSSRFDSTANGNNGTQSGGVSGVNGVIEGANSFDGTDDYINFGNTNSLNPSLVTLSAWAKFPRRGVYDGVLMHDLSNEHQRAWQFRKSNTDKAQVIFFRDNLNWITVTGTSDVGDNEWHNLTSSWDGSTVKLYVDGLLEGSEPFSGTLEHLTSEPVYIGRREDSRFQVILDEARVYDHAISAGDVFAQYNNQESPATFYSLSSEMEVDTTAPENVAEVLGYGGSDKINPIVSDSTYGYTAPYFEWEAPSEPDGMIAGYYVYFGTDVNADPEVDGIFQEGNSFVPSYLVSGCTYYLIITTRNISPTDFVSDSRVFFIYKYIEIIPPSTDDEMDGIVDDGVVNILPITGK